MMIRLLVSTLIFATHDFYASIKYSLIKFVCGFFYYIATCFILVIIIYYLVLECIRSLVLVDTKLILHPRKNLWTLETSV